LHRTAARKGLLRPLPPMDLPFLVLVLTLVAFGLVMLCSASSAVALYRRQDAFAYVRPQLLYAAMGLGALCWRWCVSHAVHRALRGTVFVLVWPLRFAADYAVHPFKQRLLARIRKIRHARRHNAQDSCKKSGKKPKNVLQNKHTILYNYCI
jgi:hypothetical protein